MMEEEDEEVLFDQADLIDEDLTALLPKHQASLQTHRESHNLKSKGPTHFYRVFSTICLCAAFLGLGLCIGIPGPTLLDLQQQTKTDTETISRIFTGRSIGYLVGCIFGGVLFDKVNQPCLLSFSLLLTAVGTALAPWCTRFLALMVVFAFQGISMGFLDTGGNVMCVHTWGADNGPWMQGLHFAFGIGAFVAPLIAEPFLSKSNRTNETLCFNSTCEIEEGFTTAISLPNTGNIVNGNRKQRNRRNVQHEKPESDLNPFNKDFVNHIVDISIAKWKRKRKKNKNYNKTMKVKKPTINVTEEMNVKITLDVVPKSKSENLITVSNYSKVNLTKNTTTLMKSQNPLEPGLDVAVTDVLSNVFLKYIYQLANNLNVPFVFSNAATSSDGRKSYQNKVNQSVKHSNQMKRPNITLNDNAKRNTKFKSSENSDNLSYKPTNPKTVTTLKLPLSHRQDTYSDGNSEGNTILESPTLKISHPGKHVFGTLPSKSKRENHRSKRGSNDGKDDVSDQDSEGKNDLSLNKTKIKSLKPLSTGRFIDKKSGIPKSLDSTTLQPTTKRKTTTLLVKTSTKVSLTNDDRHINLELYNNETNNVSFTSNETENSFKVKSVVEHITVSIKYVIHEIQGLSMVQFAYLTIATYNLLISILFLVLCCNSECTLHALKMPHSPRGRKFKYKESKGFKIQLIILLFLFFFLYVGMEITYGGLLLAFTVKHLHWSKSKGTMITSAFFGSFAAARGLTIFLAKCLSPPVILILDLVLTNLSLIAMLLSLPSNPEMMWYCTVIFGIGMASIFPTGISWAELYMDLTGKVTSTFVVGSALGEMLIPAFTGFLFEVKGPMCLIYVMTGSAILSIIIYIIMQNMASNSGEKYKKFTRLNNTTLTELDCANKEMEIIPHTQDLDQEETSLLTNDLHTEGGYCHQNGTVGKSRKKVTFNFKEENKNVRNNVSSTSIKNKVKGSILKVKSSVKQM